MSQKIDLQQLQSCSLEEIKAYKSEAQKRKTELEALKAKGNKSWTPELQEELDEVVLFLVDIDDIIEEKTANAKTSSYNLAPGTENMVHLSLVQGRRFNPLTGKEESKVFTQLFTFAEWQLFKKNYKNLGYTVVAALHDPYGDAAEIVSKVK
nr:MAG TPA: hypothetical protein [Myoviridae sp. ct1TR10]